MKTCRDCGQELPLDRFYKNRGCKDGHLAWCKACSALRYGPGVRKRADELRRRIQEIKLERGCTDCGYNAHVEALDFDHLPGYEKEYRLATMASGSTWTKILAEIEKCEVVCANCHRVRTAQRRTNKTRTMIHG